MFLLSIAIPNGGIRWPQLFSFVNRYGDYISVCGDDDGMQGSGLDSGGDRFNTSLDVKNVPVQNSFGIFVVCTDPESVTSKTVLYPSNQAGCIDISPYTRGEISFQEVEFTDEEFKVLIEYHLSMLLAVLSQLENPSFLRRMDSMMQLANGFGVL